MKSYVVVLVACAALGAAGAAAVWALRDAPVPDAVPAPADGGGETRRPGSLRWPPPDGEPRVPVEAPPPPLPLGVDPPSAGGPPPNLNPDGGPGLPETVDPALAQPGRSLRFSFPGFESAAEADWLQVGHLLRDARKRLRALVRRASTNDADPDLPTHAREAMMLPLPRAMALCAAIRGQPTEEEAPYGLIYSHPAFESNALAALLEASGRALTPEQVAELTPVWTGLVEARARHRGDPRRPWRIEDVIAWSLARDAAQPRIEAALDDGQRELLWPEDVRGRLGIDLFSPGIVWLGRVAAVQADEGADPVPPVTRTLIALSGTRDPGAEAALRERVGRWMASRPPSWRTGAPGQLARLGLVTWDEIRLGLDGLPEIADELERLARPDAGPGGDVRRLRAAVVPVRSGR